VAQAPYLPSPTRRVDAMVWAMAALTLLLHVATARGYGYFRDELYYLANGEHLGFGYVEHPPLIGLIAWLVRATLGTSLWAIRLLPALAGATTVWLAGAMARELGGGRFAQALAAAAVGLAPIYLSVFSILSMNAFDVLCWSVGWWLLIRILHGAQPRLWLLFGAVMGIGLENKISVLLLGAGVLAGLLLARRWDLLRSRWPWLGGMLAALLLGPYLAWQHATGWPLLEFMDHARRLKNAPMSPLVFVREQVVLANVLALPVWAAGLAFLLRSDRARAVRTLGWSYLGMLALLLVAGQAKPYYLAPAYSVLFAAGAVAIEHWTDRRRAGTVLRALLGGLALTGGVLFAPLAKPLLPENAFVRYAAALHVRPGSEERQRLGRLPQFFADMHGWPELAATVAGVHRALPAAERSQACIFGQNYGQAGAIDLFGPPLGLPKAISGHNSYFLWGARGCTGEVVIIIGGDPDELRQQFASVELGATDSCPDCMPYESARRIWIARGLRAPLTALWPQVKRYI
jgi:hypothetical protein